MAHIQKPNTQHNTGTTTETESARLENGAVTDENATAVTRPVTFARCLRCGFEWVPRKAVPKRCPNCISPLWNVPRAQKLRGKPAPTRQGAPRGKAFARGDANPKGRKPDGSRPEKPQETP